MPATIIPEPAFKQPSVFERGDRVYITAPLQHFTPQSNEVEEYAASKSGLLSGAPNENITWFRGQYVEADNANGNGAMWKADELAIKSLTPMLMPVTVMHDPRTAVGTIADVALLTPEKDGVTRARLDTVLALWGHRFPEAVAEAQANASRGTLMQSMECYSPWYECSACGAKFHKQPKGAEQAQWCDHLKASNPSGGFVDLASRQTSNASRILGDVCFTGTGLIFGTRGAQGAYSEAYLENFQDELAAYHQTVHTTPSTPSTPPRSHQTMGIVQIEQSELDLLRQERDTARTEKAAVDQEKAEAERKLAEAETAKLTAERERDEVKADLTKKEEEVAQANLKSERLKALGDGFTAKLGEHTKATLETKAAKLSNEDWDGELKSLEEVAGLKRDAKADGTSEKKADEDGDSEQTPDFKPEELASLLPGGGGSNGAPSKAETSAVVGSLAAAFAPTKKTA